MTDEETILDLEATGYLGIQAGDTELLRGLLAPDFVATTADGESLHRDEWVSKVTAAAAHGIRLRPRSATVTIGSGRAIVHREVIVETDAGPSPQSRRISYVTVYEQREGHWLVVLNSSRQA